MPDLVFRLSLVFRGSLWTFYVIRFGMASGLLNLSVVGDAMRLDTDIGQLARDDVAMEVKAEQRTSETVNPRAPLNLAALQGSRRTSLPCIEF